MKKTNSLVCVTFLFISLLYLFSLDTSLGDFGGDNAQYIILAQALASGKGYRAINFPGEPAYTLTPPLFPLLLVPIVHFFGYNFFLMHLLTAILAFFYLVFLFKLLQNRLKQDIVILIFFLSGINFFFVFFGLRSILAEIPYLFFSLFAFFSFERYFASKDQNKLFIFLSAVAVMAATMTRNIGVIIPICFIIFALFNCAGERKCKQGTIVLVGLLCLAPALLWSVRTALVSQTGQPYGVIRQFLTSDLSNYNTRYVSWLDLAKRLIFNIKLISGGMFSYIFPAFLLGRIHVPFLPALLRTLFVGVLGFGLWQRLKKNISLLEIYFVFYIFLLLFWHSFEIYRYLLPVSFLIFFYFFSGIEFIRNLNLPAHTRKLTVAVFYLMLTSSVLSNSWQTYKAIRAWQLNELDYRVANFLLAHKWIRDHTQNQAIILSHRSTITSLFAQRQALGYPYTRDKREIIKYLKQNNIKYVITDDIFRETKLYLLPVIMEYNRFFQSRFSLGRVCVFEFTPPNSN